MAPGENEFDIPNLCNKASTKPQKDGVWRDPRVVNASTCGERGTRQSHRDRSSCAQDLSGPYPINLFIWPFICILNNSSLCNKLANIGKCFPKLCESFWQIIEPKEGIMGTQFITGQSEEQVDLNLQLVFEVGAVLWDWALSLWHH